MANKEVVICSPVRTAVGTYGGTLKDLPAVDLGAVAIRATLERAKLSPGDVGTVVMGNVIQAGNKMNPARQAAINGGVREEGRQGVLSSLFGAIARHIELHIADPALSVDGVAAAFGISQRAYTCAHGTPYVP